MVKSEVQQEDENFVTIKINYRICQTQLTCARGMIVGFIVTNCVGWIW